MLLQYLEVAIRSVLRASWQAGVLAIIVFCVCRAFSRLPAAVRCCLWFVVLIRFLIPAAPQSWASLFNATKLTTLANQSVAEPQHAETIAKTATVIVPLSTSTRNVAAVAHESPTDDANTKTDLTWSVAIGTWLIGVVFLLGRDMASLFRLRRLLQQCAATTNEAAIGALEVSRVEAGIRRPVALLVSAIDTAPALAGLISPKILISNRTLAALGPHELRWLFRHELAHARRRDLLIQRGWRLVCAIHWFNPLAWWSAARARQATELACDESVLGRSASSEHAEYGNTLVKVAELLISTRPIPGAIGLLVGEPALTGRIRAIARYRNRSRFWRVGGFVVFVLLAFAGLTDAVENTGNAQQPSNPPAEKPSPAMTPSAPPPATSSPDSRTLIEPSELATTKGKIRIRVLKQDGTPLLGARVFANVAHPKGKKWAITNRNYLSDAAGRADVQLPNTVGVTKIWVSKPGYPELFACWFPGVQSDANVIPEEFTFQPPKLTAIGGVIKGDDGKPIQGVTVTVESAHYDLLVEGAPGTRPVFSDVHRLAAPAAAKLTNAEGRWTRNDVPAGAQVVEVSFRHPDYETVRRDFRQSLSLPQLQDFSIQSLSEQTATIWMHPRTH
ncbi:MAG TPA: M56 family metallopeptidase [Planctomycetaceae bacterium]|jgi:beta-lactamase regulating signal transducer with metallopeptidase domain|nr:M56 family metallopeptidase [Planctomycetaceae bacterium]